MARGELRRMFLTGVRQVAGLDFLALALGRRWNYAWVVLAGGMAIVAMVSGVRHSFAVFIQPLSQQFGWSLGAISFAYFLIYASGVPLSIAAGWLADNWGARRVVLVGVVLFTLGMLLTSAITQLYQFYLFFGVLMGGVSITLAGLLPAAVSRWFHRRTGLAVGLMFTSTGSGPLVLAPLFGWLIPSAGWNQAFYLVGISGGGLLLVAALLLRSSPRDLGMGAYGEAAAQPAKQLAAATAVRVSLGTVQRDYTFWFLIAIHFLGCIGHSVLLAHVVRLALFQGVPGVVAAGLLSTVSATSIASRFAIPILTERWGGRATLTLGFLVQSIAILMYLGADSTPLLYLTSALFGLGYGAEMSGFPVINRQYYGPSAPLNSIHAYEWSGGLVGMGLGGWLGGVLFEFSGSYTWSIGMAALASFAALPFILSLPGRRARQAAPAPA